MKKIIILILLAVILIGIYVLGAVNSSAGQSDKIVLFEVKTGESTAQIAQALQTQGLLKNPLAFRLYARLSGQSQHILAGSYELSPRLTMINILERLISTAAVSNERSITLLEGWTARQMADYLSQQGVVSADDFLSAIKTENWRADYQFLTGVTAPTLEGFLFPDTYRIFKKTTAREIVQKMLDNFDRKLTDELRAQITSSGRSIFATVTLASIVEREAQSETDQRMVADIFLKRLAKNIGLQSDATVNYVTGKQELRPSADDLASDSPYNTYKYRGLPPGPISNPGLTAIRAVIYPQANDYYFFLMDKDGRTHYGKTFEEHQANIRQYLE